VHAIETENLTKEYRVGFWQKRVRVLSDLSVRVGHGEIFGYLGPNGAGKTTTLKLLMGLVAPTSGEARIFGRPAGDVAAKARVGFLPEQPYFYEYLTGRELLNFYGQLAGLRRSERGERVATLASRVGIDSALDLPLRKYSKGMLQRVGLAQALLHDPQLVLLDEPMSGLDPIGRREVRDLLLRLKEDGKTVFFSSHIISDVEMVCDRVGILVGGRLVTQGSLDELGDTTVGSIEVVVSHAPPKAIQELDRLLMTAPVARGDTLLLTVKDEPALADLLARLGDMKAVIHSVIPQRESLEAYFLRYACPESGRRA
jgi:ABC-2 type transport system ATP-binding protein